ncbi:hypothetical protein RXV94_05555 [Yeosuana sp. MJ-SS3]|uniref:Tetratricopeptide repeat protein n=1 Tax=Gilvirhabdus luticola TaxID=3079858 RepID=A0ABU3U5D1_9FLAO|nr:hypothetical protein [Yeosuana sp. MJ-SS3]MDU8885616.1 hypothetical protein [Yeosuana sp. MJ-SS3]
MNNLNNIVSTLSSDDKQRFITYLERKNKRKDIKNIQLFKLLIKNELSSKDICFRLYQSHKKDAYHALRKRLYQSLIDFIANLSLDEEKALDMQIIKLILASRTFFLHKQYKVAYKILDKAEELAEENYLFPLLNEIYHTKIQYAYSNPSIKLNELIEKFNSNQKKHNLEDRLNIVYAKIRQEINEVTINSQFINFQNLVINTLKEYNIDLKEMSFKSLYQLMKIVSISAFATNDYLKIEPFLINTYESILTHRSKSKQLYYHLQVLYLISYTLFRNKKFDESLNFLQELHEHMFLKQRKYYSSLKLKYHLLLALNLNFLNQQNKAIETLKPFIITKHPDIQSLLDIYLSLVMMYFQKGEFNKARHIYSKFYHTDNWYISKIGKEWVIKKNLIEILLYIELKNIDLVESRLLSFKRNYYRFLKEINQKRVITYLNLVTEYYKAPENVSSLAFKNKVENSFTWVGGQQEDIFVMSFYAWLKSKMEKEDVYQTTLKLVQLSQNVNL